MASGAKAKKEPTKRVRLAAALRAAIEPQMRGYGFENETAEVAKLQGVSRRDLWIRERGGLYDRVSVQWDSYSRPRFWINYRTDPPGQIVGASERLCSWRLVELSIFGFKIALDSIPSGVAYAQRNLESLNQTLVREKLSPPA